VPLQSISQVAVGDSAAFVASGFRHAVHLQSRFALSSITTSVPIGERSVR
jgi:hypothetical protein